MAIYRTGQASMDADGFITGYGTKWKTALTLIRTGATIVFASNPVEYATISEIVNDTSLRAITTSGRSIPRGDYVILLHDSLTVDGLAQDVAETLRYYQGQETMYQGFVEFLKTFDWKKLEQIGNQVHTDAAAADASAKAAKASQTAAAASASNAEGSEIAARASEEAAEASENAAAASQRAAAASQSAAAASQQAAKTSETNSKASENAAAASKNAAAASQTAAKTSETNAGNSARAAAASQTAARTSETNAATSATKAAESQAAAAASQKAAAGSATTAQQQADRAKAEADRAQTANPDNQLKKANNLSDVASVSLSRFNLQVFQQRKNALSASENLNDLFGYDKSGYYHNAASANATTANNYPIQQAGVLLVTASQANGVNQTQQYYYPFARQDIYYVRHYNLVNSSWVWGAWTEYKGSQETLDSVGLNRTGVIGPKNANDIQRTSFFAGGGTDSQNYILPYQSGISMRRVNTTSQMQIDAGNGQIWTRGSVDGGAWTEWRRAAMENAVVTFQNIFSDSRSDAERAASGIMNGRLLTANGATVRHAWRVYSEVRSDNKTYMTMHLQAPNGNNKYLGFSQDGDLSGINNVTCVGINAGTNGITVNGGGECYKMKGTDPNAAMYMIARNSDNSLNWYVGKGSRDNDQVVLHSYKYNTTLQIRQGDIAVTKDLTVSGNSVTLGSTVYVDGGDGASNTHFWLRNRSKRSRGVIYTNDSQAITIRSDNGATGGSGQALVIRGTTGECLAVKFTATSDERAKFWMKPVTGALDKICQLRGMTYSMHTTRQNTVRNAGIIAQDVQKVLPEAVTVREGSDHMILDKNCEKVENPLSLDYNAMSALYVEAFKELKAENESLRAEIESMKASIAQMQTMFTQLAK